MDWNISHLFHAIAHANGHPDPSHWAAAAEGKFRELLGAPQNPPTPPQVGFPSAGPSTSEVKDVSKA
jgi:hypothetical protein